MSSKAYDSRDCINLKPAKWSTQIIQGLFQFFPVKSVNNIKALNEWYLRYQQGQWKYLSISR